MYPAHVVVVVGDTWVVMPPSTWRGVVVVAAACRPCPAPLAPLPLQVPRPPLDAPSPSLSSYCPDPSFLSSFLLLPKAHSYSSLVKLEAMASVMKTVSPVDGSVVCEIPLATPAEVERARERERERRRRRRRRT